MAIAFAPFTIYGKCINTRYPTFKLSNAVLLSATTASARVVSRTQTQPTLGLGMWDCF